MTQPTDDEMRRILPHALISAVRYALGRRTYIVSDTCSWVRTCLPLLDKGTLDVMIRDIEEQAARRIGELDPLGDNCDRKDWLELLEVLRKARELQQDTVTRRFGSGKCGLTLAPDFNAALNLTEEPEPPE